LSARLLALLAALIASAGLAAPAHGERPRPSTATGASVPAPTVTGPVARTSPVGDPAHGYPFLATDVDLASAGYVEQEFHISGEATRYSANGSSTGTVISTGHPYRTRIVVRRPRSARAFNGVVIAEWFNVSNQWDQEVDWFQTMSISSGRGMRGSASPRSRSASTPPPGSGRGARRGTASST
jgi:Alpha/beta hydrolase domain